MQPDLHCDGKSFRLYFAGQPEALHITLTQTFGGRRVVLGLAFPQADAMAAPLRAALQSFRLPNGTALEMKTARKSDTHSALLPRDALAAAIAALAAAVARALPPPGDTSAKTPT